MPAESKFDNLNDGNYIEWKIYMEALLVRKNLLEVVDGTERHPGGNEGTKKVKDFYRKQAEARAEITLHVSPSQLVYCRDTDPYQIWTTLANAHQARGRSTVLALRRCFHRLHLEKTETMTAYIARVRYAAFLLEEAKVKVSNDDVILAITAGLPHSYDHFLVSLDTLTDSEYTLNAVITRLNNEYQRQHMYLSTPTPRTFASSTPLPSPENANSEALTVTPMPRLAHITCFTCGNKGHYQANCPSRAPANPTTNPASPINANIAEEDDHDVSF